MTFRDRLLATLERLRPVLEEPGVLIVGSEVPNLLQPQAASTLVVSQDVGVAVPVGRLEAVKARLRDVRDLVPSEDEPSVYVPTSPGLIEATALTVLSLMTAHAGMPDPAAVRSQVEQLLARIEERDG